MMLLRRMVKPTTLEGDPIVSRLRDELGCPTLFREATLGSRSILSANFGKSQEHLKVPF